MAFLYYLIILVIMLIYISILCLLYGNTYLPTQRTPLPFMRPACAKAVPNIQRRGEPNLELGYTPL